MIQHCPVFTTPQITQETLLLWGKEDEILPVPLADKWQAALSSVKRVDIEKAG